jgi:hypothetical protein
MADGIRCSNSSVRVWADCPASFFSRVFSLARSCVFIDWFYAAIMKGLRVEPIGRMEIRATEEEILQFGWASLR